MHHGIVQSLFQCCVVAALTQLDIILLFKSLMCSCLQLASPNYVDRHLFPPLLDTARIVHFSFDVKAPDRLVTVIATLDEVPHCLAPDLKVGNLPRIRL